MVTLSAGVVSSMFFFTYLPQLAVLIFVNGPLAVFTTVFLILSESSTIVSLISRNFLLQEALLDTFDGVLVIKGTTNLVSEGRQLQPGSDPIGMSRRMPDRCLLVQPYRRTPTFLFFFYFFRPCLHISVLTYTLASSTWEGLEESVRTLQPESSDSILHVSTAELHSR